MNRKSPQPSVGLPPIAPRQLIATACLLAALSGGDCIDCPRRPAPPSRAAVPASQPQPDLAATLDECVVPALQGERYATFAAEMTTLPGAARMQIRIEVQVRLPGETVFHAIAAPGLSAWRASDANVHVYKYLRQVTNLAAPAVYRALVHFRWLSDRGVVIRRAERLTARCVQPAPASAPASVDRLTRRPGA